MASELENDPFYVRYALYLHFLVMQADIQILVCFISSYKHSILSGATIALVSLTLLWR